MNVWSRNYGLREYQIGPRKLYWNKIRLSQVETRERERGKRALWVRRLALAFHSFHVLCGRPKLKPQSRNSQPQTQTQTQIELMASHSLSTLSVSPTWSWRRQPPSASSSTTTVSVSSSASFASRRRRSHVVRMAPEEEKLTRRNPLDFPIVCLSMLDSIALKFRNIGFVMVVVILRFGIVGVGEA